MPASQNAIDENRLAELLTRVGEAASAYISGDVRRYLALFDHPADYSLMSPFGGDTMAGFDPTEEQLEATSEFFASGEATLEVHHTYPRAATGRLTRSRTPRTFAHTLRSVRERAQCAGTSVGGAHLA